MINNSVVAWVSVIGSVVTAFLTVVTVYKALLEAKNLRGRNVKELLELIAEAQRRIERDSDKAWRYPDAKLPKCSFEDCLAKDMLASQIFGRTITWSDWVEIRKFLMDHEDVRLNLLRYAWPYRDQRKAPCVSFRMTLSIRWNVLLYVAICWGTLLLFCLGFTLVQISLNPLVIQWLISVIPQLPKLLVSLGIRASNQLLALGALIMAFTLFPFILNVVWNYDGYAAHLIRKKTESRKRRSRLCGDEATRKSSA